MKLLAEMTDEEYDAEYEKMAAKWPNAFPRRIHVFLQMDEMDRLRAEARAAQREAELEHERAKGRAYEEGRRQVNANA